VAALPFGSGARIAVVIDDLGGADTYIDPYLTLDIPLTFAVMPYAARASVDDAKIRSASQTALLHIPLPIGADLHPEGGVGIDASTVDVQGYLDGAMSRVPDAVGANNHQGSLGTSTPALMEVLLPALAARQLWFLDSVTSQQTVAYAIAVRLGMPSRINNVFLDNDASEAAARAQLLALARLAAANGSAIGIAHVTRPWAAAALQQVAGQLQRRGYTFVSTKDVTNLPAGPLDAGVRTRL